MLKESIWLSVALLSAIAGWTDLKSRRIPNWLTVPGLLVGITLNSATYGWEGAKDSLLGAALGLLLLLPPVLIRALGAGDWKLVGALGGFLGPHNLIVVLLISVFVNGIIALGMIVQKRRVRETLGNLAHMLKSLLIFQLPGRDLTLDNPDSVKVPFGVAVALAVLAYSVHHFWVVS
ncbi:MAG: prepilin peptidase [Acidobacteriota bacterium]|nr:prepilin peptidase [Acidobacteriota bacterium]